MFWKRKYGACSFSDDQSYTWKREISQSHSMFKSQSTYMFDGDPHSKSDSILFNEPRLILAKCTSHKPTSEYSCEAKMQNKDIENLTLGCLYSSLLAWLVGGMLIAILVAMSKLWQGKTSLRTYRHMARTKAISSKFRLIPLMACIVWVGKSYPINPVEVDAVTSTLAGAISYYVPE